jgi:uncharacterized protein (DUF2252 family)
MTTPRPWRESGRIALPVPRLRTLAERYALGKALREKVPRGRHAGWQPPSRRRDPIDILIESSTGRIPSLLPIRYGRMLQSPFTFYRGAAAIMAADLASTPKTGVRVQACGDCHLLNFGGFATPERRIIFDINDFDETLPAPWEWDVKRLSASFVVAGRSNRFTKRDARAAAAAAVRSYREHVASSAEMPTLQAWYASVSGLVETLGNPRLRRRYERVVREEREHGSAHEFAELAHYVDGVPRIKDDPPLVYHADIEHDPAFWRRVHRELRRYRESLPDDRRVLFDRFQLCDMAAKVVGVGSVGTACAVALFLAAKEDPLFLQFKEAHSSVLEPFAGKSAYANHGERVVTGQRLMQAASDIFLGWTTGEEARHFYVRQLRDIKIKPVIEIMEPADLVSYADACGWALARAHARSGDAAVLAGYMGKGTTFDEAIADFAVAYADQNERDHHALVEAVRAGRIKVKPGT